MRVIRSLLLLSTLLLLHACGGDTTTEDQTDSQASTDTINTEEAETARSLFPDQSEACDIGGQILEGNRFWARQAELMVVMKADSTTTDPTLGESHRVLEVYGRDCQLVDRSILPVNKSPDFPYYLAEITYNNSSQILAIRGFNTVHLYDLKQRKLLPALEPQFKTERYGVDAQSGRIEHLEVWEDYLIGHSRDFGSFAFRLDSDNTPEPVMPFAEYKYQDRYFPVFILQSGSGGQQLILPSYDRRSNKFSINPVLSKPADIEKEKAVQSEDKRYLAIPFQAEAILIDLKEHERISIPENRRNEDLRSILDWAMNASSQ